MIWRQIQHKSDYLPGKLQCTIIFEDFNQILFSLFFFLVLLVILNSMSLRKKCNHTIHLLCLGANTVTDGFVSSIKLRRTWDMELTFCS